MNFREILNFRRAIRIYDGTPVPDQIIKESIEDAILSPSSSNLQLWEFYRIVDPSKKQEIVKACFNQNAAKTASELIVFVVRQDKWKNRCDANIKAIESGDRPKSQTGSNYYTKTIPILYTDFLGFLGWVKKAFTFFKGLTNPMYREVLLSDVRVMSHKSVALAAQTFMLSMASKGYDTCPMEGFDSKRVSKIMNLPRKAEINMIISCGKRSPEGVYGNRFRIPKEEVYFEI